jgi:putative redox protein
MKARIKWLENVAFVAESESGHAMVMDGAPEGGGRNLGPRPMETLLMGAGGCTAYDVVHILKKSRAPITDCVVEIDAERAAEDPKVFTKIHFHFVVTGKALKPQQVERAVHSGDTRSRLPHSACGYRVAVCRRSCSLSPWQLLTISRFAKHSCPKKRLQPVSGFRHHL